MKNIKPIAENADIGFYYEVTQEQVDQHRKRSFKEILSWLDSTQKLINSLQTVEEKARINHLKRKNTKQP